MAAGQCKQYCKTLARQAYKQRYNSHKDQKYKQNIMPCDIRIGILNALQENKIHTTSLYNSLALQLSNNSNGQMKIGLFQKR